MRNLNCNVLLGANSVNQTGIQIDSNQLIATSFQFVFGDATAAGTGFIQMSNDIAPDRYQATQGSNFTVTNWTNIPSASVAIAGGSSAVITMSQICYRWLRANFTHTSGGTTTVACNMDALSL